MERDRKKRALRTGDYSLEELRILRPLIRPGDPRYIGRYPYDGYEEAKPHIFKRDGYVCQSCGRTIGDTDSIYGGKHVHTLTRSDFVVHHVNHDKRDQRHSNLIILCNSCNRSKLFRSRRPSHVMVGQRRRDRPSDGVDIPTRSAP
jgi:5-methylcytosine-specific restriction endonuclease McrA